MSAENLEAITPDAVFDGGDMDCGSGLILLIRENMMPVAVGGILEMRSNEPTVHDDLPPWCRMSGHEYLGIIGEPSSARYFIRKGEKVEQKEDLQKDKEDAKKYEWRLRIRSTGKQKSTVYARNFSYDVGQAASFEEKDAHPSGLEYLLGGLGGALTTAFATECSKEGLDVDDIEVSITATLHNVLAHLGLEEGDPSLATILVKCFASTFDDEDKVQQAWQTTTNRSPLFTTLAKAADVQAKVVII